MRSPNTLQFSPDILRRLGEELIPHVDQGIIELVRNAYDADARDCTIELRDTGQPGGTLRVSDDGAGMTTADIRTGWLVLGRSGKAVRRATTKLGRLPVGDKGLGRLAALRLGARAKLATRPESEPGVEYSVTLDWSQFERAATVESVPVEITRESSKRPPGTDIEVSDLRTAIALRDVQRLARSLALLAAPFEDSVAFRPRLLAPGHEDVARRVTDLYFGDADYRLEATLNEDGDAEAVVYDAAGQAQFTSQPDDFATHYNTAAASFEFWAFILDPQRFSAHAAKVGEIREWLSEVGGVHVYHRGLRVSPYGDPGHDWLETNLRRVRSPEFRPSTNNSIGRLVVPDPGEVLLQKTDRAGFVENEAFVGLRQFAVDALEWMAHERQRVGEARRERERRRAPRDISQARTAVSGAIRTLPREAQATVRSALATLDQARDREVQTLREDVQLYRTMATVGTASAVFAHESAQPVTRIEKAAREVEAYSTVESGIFDRDHLRQLAQLIIRSCRAWKGFASLPINLLRRDKRTLGAVDVHAVIRDVLALFRPFLEDAKIHATADLVDDAVPAVVGTVSALESVLANLLMNAAYALMYASPKPPRCSVSVQTSLSGGMLVLRVMDNGPGVTGIPLDEIWLPGRTTKTRGTGLGLTIVRDTVADLQGTVRVVSPGEMGGAEFVAALPLKGGRT
jgi:signal transduction histidine kinase